MLNNLDTIGHAMIELLTLLKSDDIHEQKLAHAPTIVAFHNLASNMRPLSPPSFDLWVIHIKWLCIHSCGSFEANYGINYQVEKSNHQNA